MTKRRNYVKISEFKEHVANPFMEDKVVKTKKKNILAGSSKKLIIGETGEVEGHTTFIKIKEVDQEKFVKVFLDEIKIFYSLSKSAIKVLFYFMNETKPNKDVVLFTIDECMEFTEIAAHATIYRAIGELIEANIIARSKRHYMYYINPHIFFNGDRVSFAKQYVVKKKEQAALKKPE